MEYFRLGTNTHNNALKLVDKLSFKHFEALCNHLLLNCGKNRLLNVFNINIILFLLSTILYSSQAYGYTYDQFVPFGKRQAALIVQKSNFNIRVSQWANKPEAGPQNGFVWGSPDAWNDSNVEEFTIKKKCFSHDLVWLNAYRNDVTGHRWKVEMTAGQYVDLDEGKAFDISAGGDCGTMGHPYAVYNVYDTPYIIRIWGNIYTDNKNSGAKDRIGKRFFWEHKITLLKDYVYNPCWAGGGGQFRKAIRQEEAWWQNDIQNGNDNGSGKGEWKIGSGKISPKTDEPSGKGVVYGNYQTIAKDLGPGWTLGSMNNTAKPRPESCMRYNWTY